MPSPFPGMDPYLEHPRLWPDVHHEIISEIRAQLNASLLPKYVVRIEERTYVTDDYDPGLALIIPDLKIHEQLRSRAPSAGSGSSGTMAVAEHLIATTLINDEITEAFLQVIDQADRSVVTVIELLSPTNKHPGAYGEGSYRKKRAEVMKSETHLVEIDLLRGGRRMKILGRLPDSDYLVHVSRVEERPRGRLWPIRLTQQLPAVSIPLRGGDADVTLDLQRVLNSAYERAGYGVEIDYRDDANPPLAGEAAAWADGLLKERQLR